MSEQEKPKSFMQELDRWTDAYVISPLVCSNGDEGEEITDETLKLVKYAIREKVLESYKNGLKAQPRNQAPARKERSYAQPHAQTRAH